MAVAVVGELVVSRRKLLEALRSYAGEVAGEFRELGENHRPTRHEAVDQRLLPHRFRFPNPNPKRETYKLPI